MNKTRALLLDLDGTLYFKGAQISGANDVIGELRRKGFILRFLTNTDSCSATTLQLKVEQIGLAIDADEIFTPVTALQQFLRHNPGKNCLFLLSDELTAEFEHRRGRGDRVDYVVVGDFRQSVSYETLNTAFRHIMAGADIIALQKGRFFLNSTGVNLDTGAFVSLLEYASGKTACVLGKPAPEFFNFALDQIGYRADEVAIIGDDLSTDILGAKQIGATAILVRTGKYDAEALIQSNVQPDHVIDSVANLLKLMD